MFQLNMDMPSNWFKGLFLLIFLVNFTGVAHAEEHHFLVLNYHDIVRADSAKSLLNSMDVSVDHLEEHLVWLKKNSYKIISVQNVLDAAAGKNAIPVSYTHLRAHETDSYLVCR